MAISYVTGVRNAGTVAVTSAAIVGCLIGITQNAAADEPFDSYTDKGALRLQLGPSSIGPHQPNRFVYETKGKPDRGTSWTQSLAQGLSISGKCGLNLATNPSLVELSSLPGSLGLGPDSIGVYDGPKGVACYRITSAIYESVTVNIGTAVKNLGARSFYRLQLDIEVKQNAVFFVDILRGGVPYDTYELQTGSNIDSRSDPTSASSQYPKVQRCSAKSDSGPDSGSGDNCTWIIDELGTGFTLRAGSGEGSLEGGGDWGGGAYDHNTIVYLTDVDVGVLGCGSTTAADAPNLTNTIGDGLNEARCSVTRIDPSVDGGTCTENIGYVFKTLSSGGEGCELIKEPGEQLVALLDIAFPPEPWSAMQSAPKTQVSFPIPNTEPATYVTIEIPRCEGTLTTDPTTGQPIITGVLDNDALDQVSETDNMEWACILVNDEEYVGIQDVDGSTQEALQVRQKILFWGDIGWSRF